MRPGGKLTLGFHGAAGEVTGSRHLLELNGRSLLLDCGMFQGHRTDAAEKNRTFLFPPASVDAVLLSHAHIDHSGLLPALYRDGCRAHLYATPGTAEISAVMLADSARLQEMDARFYNKTHAAEGLAITPLYTEEDVALALAHFRPAACDAVFEPIPGAAARFLNAGHVLGSAMIQLDLAGPTGTRRLLYTGDLGREDTLLLKAPVPPDGVDYLVIESTYGDRLHEPLGDAEEKLAGIIKRAIKENGKIIIPSFALERTQEIIFIIDKLRRFRTAPEIPVYVDSPMAVNLTEVFSKRRDDFCFAEKFRDYARSDGDPFGFDFIRYLRTREESQTLNNKTGPMLIISASGMCEGGRVLHHLRNNIEKENTTVLLVGYQAEGTLGRRLQDGSPKVRIFGLEHEVWAKVETMHSFSSHADRSDLLAFIKAVKPARRTFLVHGDQKARETLRAALSAAGDHAVVCPRLGETLPLD